jgi:hypothetical protein
VQADVDMALRLGLDLEGPDKSFFVDVDETSLTASARAFGENLAFEAGLGPVGVFVIGGSASLDGSFTVDLLDAGASDSDGRLILLGFDGNNLSSDLVDLLDFLDMDIDGTAEVVLPLFYGLESSPAPMGNHGQQVIAPYAFHWPERPQRQRLGCSWTWWRSLRQGRLRDLCRTSTSATCRCRACSRC